MAVREKVKTRGVCTEQAGAKTDVEAGTARGQRRAVSREVAGR